MKKYKQEDILKAVRTMLKYYMDDEQKEYTKYASYLLLEKIVLNEDDIELDKDFINKILFIENKDETKTVVRSVFNQLRMLQADMKDISFNNVHIKSLNFNGLENVEINIDEIPNKDISEVSLNNVKVTGTLKRAKINGTSFEGYKGDLVLNPQEIIDQNLHFTHLGDLYVKGSFDDVYIVGMRTTGFRGSITIDPQKVKCKDISCVDFYGVTLTGKDGITNFEGCRMAGCEFKGAKGNFELPEEYQEKTLYEDLNKESKNNLNLSMFKNVFRKNR